MKDVGNDLPALTGLADSDKNPYISVWLVVQQRSNMCRVTLEAGQPGRLGEGRA